jgi:hypothetical protein
MDEQSRAATCTVEETPRRHEKSIPWCISVLGLIWMVGGSFAVAFAGVAKHHAAIYFVGGLLFAIAGLALLFVNRAENDDREFFGGR